MSDVDGSGMGVDLDLGGSTLFVHCNVCGCSCVFHPFSAHKLDAGPIRLVTIAHAFNYWMAVLRDDVKSSYSGRTFP